MAKTASKAPQPDAPKADWAETTEQQVLDAALKIIPQEGWTSRMAAMAGKACGLSAGETELLLPQGPADLAALFVRRHDARALERLAEVDPAALKIRERIARAIEARMEAAAEDGPTSLRCAAFLALPTHALLGARLAWASADVLWRWAGDTATDENHYTKRALLAGILVPAISLRLTVGRAEALAFADRRIANVMAFETWKRTTKLKPSEALDRLATALARARYGR